MLSKEYLIEHYFNKFKTYEQIGKENNIDPSAVGFWMRKYGLKGRKYRAECVAGKNRRELLGQKFGKLTVISLVDKKYSDRQARWICKCDCGGTTIVRSSLLLNGKTKSCKCLRRQRTNWTGYGEISGAYWYQICSRAEIKEQSFDISIEYAWELFLNQDRKCALSGVFLTFATNLKKHSEQTASLDRIDSSKGYVEHNVQWVHKSINKMKLDHSVGDFVEWCRKVVEVQAGRPQETATAKPYYKEK